ncbi:aminopeptidase N [Streptomyces sp. NPDC005438]|uniref:aminopeptidase N n=1 Tax=Streptomyces sp. NPDC005438 TaxID=3156880 RepID=UPI0033B4A0F2
MPALTRAEAQRRAESLTVHEYRVHLDLTTGGETFESDTTLDFTVHADDTDSFVELRPETLHGVELDGRSLPIELTDNRLALSRLPAGRHQLTVRARMAYSRTGEGMHRFTDPADGQDYVYTQCFLADAQRVFAAFDQPDLKAVFHLAVTAPEDWTALANTRVRQHTGNRWDFAPTEPLPSYLVAVAAGPWHSVTAEHHGLPLGLHCRRSLAPHLDAEAPELLEITRGCLDTYRELFTEPYPFDSYDQAFVPEFNHGAMENPGLVTFREEFVYRSAVTDGERHRRAMVVAHEMAHMWFGDLVTLRWWNDIWLNESFAEYMGFHVLDALHRTHPEGAAPRWCGTRSWTHFAAHDKNSGYDADQRPSTHPVATEGDQVPHTALALLNFDGISYAKGASALRQLVAWLGESDFLAGVNEHFRRHRFGNATLDDLLDSLAAHTSRDVHQWARDWLGTTGVDTLTPVRGEPLTLDHRGRRPHRLTLGVYDLDPADRLTLRERPTLDLPVGPGERSLPVTGPEPDLLLLNDQDLSYAKVRLDPRSWATATHALSTLPDPLARMVLWNAARDMVQDGQLAPAAYLETVRAHLPPEPDVDLVRSVLAYARDAVCDRHLAPDQRGAALAGLHELARTLWRVAEERGDDGLRLAAVRSFVDSAGEPGELLEWWTGQAIPGGPELDAELNWRLLLRLSVLGAVGEPQIERARSADPSATGVEGAARCRAALPEAAAKEAAWDTLFGTGSRQVSNYLFIATAQGFWQPEQLALTAPYVDRYFEAAAQLAESRGAALGGAAGRYAFPRFAVEPATLKRGQRFLETRELPPSLRRRLVDQLDDLARALRVRRAHD